VNAPSGLGVWLTFCGADQVSPPSVDFDSAMSSLVPLNRLSSHTLYKAPLAGPGDLRHTYRHPVDDMQVHMGRDEVKHAMAERSRGQTKVNLGQNAGLSVDRDLTWVPRFAAKGG
jgi:hypothetical protein